MTLFEMMGLISTVALVVPILILLSFKLAWYRSFPGLFAYLVILIICNLVLLNYIRGGPVVKIAQNVMHNLLEQPLALFFLTYFSRTPSHRKAMKVTLYALLGFEVIIVAIYGLTPTAFTIIKFPALIVTLFYSLTFFIHQVKLSITYQKAIGKALIACSFLFATVGFCYVNAVVYFTGPDSQKDADLIFFMITSFFSISLSIGFLFERKRVRQLTEIRTAREELKALYGEEHEKATPPYGTVALNFEQDQWN